MYKRIISLDKKPTRSFFLWGPRQTGKSSFLKKQYPDALYIDLLKTEEFISFQQNPAILRERIRAAVKNKSFRPLVIIDEIQKVPSLLNEVHYLIENQAIIFGLCGSSARKVRRGHANLLGGRADRFEMFGLVSPELESEFDLMKILNQGYLPSIYSLKSYERAVRSYCVDYLKEEIANEGLIRNLPQFSTFLEMAALADTEQINFATIARDCAVSAPGVKNYFEILEDTLIGTFLPAYKKRPKRRISLTPKFYFFDVAFVNYLAKRGKIQERSELFGKAFENYIFHEIRAHSSYKELHYPITYWRLSTGTEVDFILGDMEIAIEVKGSAKITSDHLRGLRELKKDYPKVKRSIIVSMEKEDRTTDEGIEIIYYKNFLQALWSGNII